ncbi:MAG: carboxypeptidase regulatory-like domain-containing protein [Candidatus Ozemobacteraceae bacterium]
MKFISPACCLLFLMFTISCSVGCHNVGYGNFGGSASDASSGTGIISGSVTASGAVAVSARLSGLRGAVKIASATVWLQQNFNIASSSDANGNFTLTGIPLGNNQRIIARFQLRDNAGNLTTYKVRSPELPVTETEPVQSDVNLDLQVASNTVAGILRDSQGNPIPFATLMLWGEPFKTDGEGRFLAPPLPPPPATDTTIETIIVTIPGFVVEPITTAFGVPGTVFVEATMQKSSESNKPPRIMLFRDPSEKSVAAGGKTTLWAVYYDLDGSAADLQPLSWDISEGTGASSSTPLPISLKPAVDLLTFGISTGKILVEALSWTAPMEEGYQAITARVRDSAGAEGRVTLKVPVANPLGPLPAFSVNRPPVPTVNATGTAPTSSTVSLEAVPNDPDGNYGMTYAWSVKPADGKFSTSRAGQTVWTVPSATGTYEFNCLVTDSEGLTGKATHYLVVYPADTAPPEGPNQSPAPQIVSLRVVTTGHVLSLKTIPNDPDGDVVSYAWSVDPVGGNFSTVSSPIATWTAPTKVGTYTLQCAVSDGRLTATATQRVAVVSDTPVTSPRRISGYVRDITTDVPIVGALVVISGTDRYAITGADGYFQFTEVTPGTYTVIATLDGYQSRTFAGIVVPGS